MNLKTLFKIVFPKKNNKIFKKKTLHEMILKSDDVDKTNMSYPININIKNQCFTRGSACRQRVHAQKPPSQRVLGRFLHAGPRFLFLIIV